VSGFGPARVLDRPSSSTGILISAAVGADEPPKIGAGGHDLDQDSKEIGRPWKDDLPGTLLILNLGCPTLR
jgi:hypothetical protein